jgi:predicted AlkP superfamily pyrophosphatase or phosphodiesterase
MPVRKIACFLFLFATSLIAQQRHPVLMISIDGLRPDYVTHADEHQLKIPTLRRFLAEGTYADGVVGVFPTVTYPSHTTLVTGVWPAEHGILNNTRFDPERKFGGAWYWYADQIKVPTLWSAAKAAGLHTASVSWPVTVDATPIDFLIPEYWRTSAAESSNPDDRFMMNAVSRPDGELQRISERVNTPYMMGNDTSPEGDEVRTLYSLDILKQHKPEFMTIHLSSLDEEEHLHGPFSEEANADLEKIRRNGRETDLPGEDEQSRLCDRDRVRPWLRTREPCAEPLHLLSSGGTDSDEELFRRSLRRELERRAVAFGRDVRHHVA